MGRFSYSKSMEIKRLISTVLANPELYERTMRRLINEKLIFDFERMNELEDRGIIEGAFYFHEQIEIKKLNPKNREYVKDLLGRYSSFLFRDVLEDEYDPETKNRNIVSGFFGQILVEKRINVEDFHPFVRELYEKYDKKIGEGVGHSTVYSVRQNPTFMGEMLAKFILDGKGEGIDFTDKSFPLKETVAKEYFGKLWKQKMLFLDLLQKIRYEGKIPYKVIEKFVDKTFVKSEKRAFIIKAFVEMAKNRGLDIGNISQRMKERANSFLMELVSDDMFKEKITESEIMQGVEGFSWKNYTRKRAEVKKRESRHSDSKKAITNNERARVSKVIELIEERKEISLPELGRAVKEAGYKGRAKCAWNAGLVAGMTVDKIIRKIESLGIKITHKNELSDEEKSLIIEKAKEKESVKRDEIKAWLRENGRILEGFLGEAVSEGMAMLEKMGYRVEGKMRAPGKKRIKEF